MLWLEPPIYGTWAPTNVISTVVLGERARPFRIRHYKHSIECIAVLSVAITTIISRWIGIIPHTLRLLAGLGHMLWHLCNSADLKPTLHASDFRRCVAAACKLEVPECPIVSPSPF